MTTKDHEPILASWKISEVLQKHPDLLDYLIDLTPAFKKLRNPVMRKVQTRLVTVEQAAKIAGVDPRVLTRKLNQEVGITAPDAVSSSGAPDSVAKSRPSWFGQTEIAQELDVRPMLERGEEPFKLISVAARAVPVGKVLRLIVGFEPLPLYDALGKQGFAHWGEQDVLRLLGDSGIVRHRGKIEGTIRSARSYLRIDQREGFADFLWNFQDGQVVTNHFATLADVPAHTPTSVAMSKALKAEGFTFCGPTIVYAFMQATGMVNDHLITCTARR